MTVWALRGPNQGCTDWETDEECRNKERMGCNPPDLRYCVNFIAGELVCEGICRFGWSCKDSANLKRLRERPLYTMDDIEKYCYNKAKFLLDVKIGDWIVYVNLPAKEFCIAGRVNRSYEFDRNRTPVPGSEPRTESDFRHMIGIDINTMRYFKKKRLPNVCNLLDFRERYKAFYGEDAENFISDIEDVELLDKKFRMDFCEVYSKQKKEFPDFKYPPPSEG